MKTIYAAPDMVLCDGYSKTSLGGKVVAPDDSDLSMWQEMSEAEADALIEVNTVEE